MGALARASAERRFSIALNSCSSTTRLRSRQASVTAVGRPRATSWAKLGPDSVIIADDLGFSMDAPLRAKSGHQGTGMALAPLGHVLYSRIGTCTQEFGTLTTWLVFVGL